jgi:radical SAM protein with 4Fe4S-binding SPASM domain
MSPDEFGLVVEKIRPYTNYIYLHVLGEPLLHPQLEEILKIAANAGLNVNITTNGGLIERKKEILWSNPVRQINISLHDAEENIAPEKWNDYLNSIFEYAEVAAEKTYINLRLWNLGVDASTGFNAFCIQKITENFQLPTDFFAANMTGNGLKITDHIFLQRLPRFEWPDEKHAGKQTRKTCYALRDHIAILANGEVVPCCLDANANLLLGNIFFQNLDEILQTDKAKNIKKGFEQHKIVEPLCATCGFILD